MSHFDSPGIQAGRANRAGVPSILQVCDTLEMGGAQRAVVDLSIALHDRGYRLTLAVSSAGSLAGEVRAAGVTLVVLGDRAIRRSFNAGYARALRDLVAEGRFDLVHSHLHASDLAAAVLGERPPWISTVHSEGTWREPPARRAHRRALARTQGVIAVSPAIACRLSSEVPAPPLVWCVPNAVRPTPVALEELLPGDPALPVVGVIARLVPEKGLGILLDAAVLVARSGQPVRWVIVGDGPLRAALEREVERLGLRGIVFLLGERPAARALLTGFDLLVVPSLTEGTPLVVLEALMDGVPLVASATGGIPCQVRDGHEGMLVPPRDPVALASAVVRLLDDPALRCRLVWAGRQRAMRGGHAALVDRTECIYKVVLAGQGTRPDLAAAGVEKKVRAAGGIS